VDKGGHDLRPAAYVHFFKDVVEMGFEGLLADIQLGRDGTR
jgi:hypothetical protein